MIIIRFKNILVLSLALVFLNSCEKEEQKIENRFPKSYYEYDDFVEDGLVAYYPFNENANDSSGNQLNGRMYNVSNSVDRFGNENGSLMFNGINSSIEISNSFLLNGNAYTICFWYRADLSDTLEQSIISKSDSSRFGYSVSVYNRDKFSYTAFSYRASLLPFESWSRFGPSFRSWSQFEEREFEFVAVAFNEKDFVDYLGGSIVRQSPAMFFNTNDYELFIGKSNNKRYKHYKGELDDLLIYNRILEIEEVEKLYNWTK